VVMPAGIAAFVPIVVRRRPWCRAFRYSASRRGIICHPVRSGPAVPIATAIGAKRQRLGDIRAGADANRIRSVEPCDASRESCSA